MICATLSELIKARSSTADRGVYLIQNDRETKFISYGQLYSSAHYTLSVLQAKGMKPGNELLFQVEDPEHYLNLFWACILGGIIAVPVLVGSNDEHKQRVLNISGYLTNPYLVTDRNNLRQLENYMDGKKGNIGSGIDQTRVILLDDITEPQRLGQLHTSSGEDIAFVQFSSGSTGDPKGVILTHDNLLANINAIRIAANVTSDDRLLSWMPLTHDMGMIGCHLVPLMANIDQYIMETALFIRTPTLWLRKASELKASLLASPNFGYKHVLAQIKEQEEHAWDLSGVRLIINGAEPISVPLVERFMIEMQGYGLRRNAMLPVYGLAEASLGVTIPPEMENIKPVHLLRGSMRIGEQAVSADTPDDGSITFVDVGAPIQDCEVRISGPNGEQLSDWTIGYIHIRGKNVTQGYYGNPAATEATIRDGWLNTGDLGLMRNGRLVITGRAKDIIIVNGQNYYPHDVERIVEEISGTMHPAAVCSVSESEAQTESIYIFIQFIEPAEQFAGLAREIHKAIHSKMGLQVKCVLPIQRIPKTASGKIQRYQLAERIEAGEFDALIEQISSLRSELEKQEAECFEETLSPVESALLAMARSIVQTEFIGPDTNLLEAGLDSLKLQQLLNLMEAQFNVRVSTQELFENPNIRALSRSLEEWLSSAAEEPMFNPVANPPFSPDNLIPLSSPQKRLFILQSMNRESLAYNNPMGWMLEGALSLKQLNEIFRELISRHEAWRTSFLLDGDEPMQRIHKPEDLLFKIDYADMEHQHIEVSTLFDAFVRPFELAKAPLVRVKLVRLENRKHLLMMDAHHLVADGTSRAIFIKEFMNLIAGYALPPLAYTYKEYVMHQQWLRDSQTMVHQREYWLNRLSGAKDTVFRLPSDMILPQENAPLSRTFRFHLSKELVLSSKELAARQGMTLFMIFFAAYAYILAEYNGQEKVVVGVPTSGRQRKEWESVIGMFAGTLPILCEPAAGLTVQEFLHDIRTVILEAFDNQLYPLENLIQDLNLQRDAGKNPLFETLFVFQNMEHPVIRDSELRILPLLVDEYEAKFDLAVEIEEEEGVMQVKLRYDTAKYGQNTVERIGAHFIEVLNGFTKDEDILLGQLQMLPDQEKQQLLSDFQGIIKPLPATGIQEMLDRAAYKYPDHFAVITPDLQLTYKDLHHQADRLVGRLHSLGIKPGSLIGLMTGRTAYLCVGIVGILKAGCAFVPVDSGSPADRTERILVDSACSVLVVQGDTASARSFAGHIIDLEDANFEEEVPILPTVYSHSDLVYSIYTSGSTGAPKGVLLENRGLVNYVEWFHGQAGLCEDDRAVLVSSFAFDLGYTSLFGALTCGCELHIVPESHLLDPSELLAYLERNRITVIKMTPSLFHLLVDAAAFNRTNLSALRLIVLGGEPIQAEDVAEYYRAYPNARIMNHYGPTECTIGCIAQYIAPEGLEAFKLHPTLGNPIANTRIHVLDSERKLRPIGIPGEIHIGGAGVARGYRESALTDQAFIEVDLRCDGSSPERVYRTGDLGRYLADGRIEFLGRTDNQVKIRGYRVELAEIENRLNLHPDIRQAVVISRLGPTAALELCAYVVLHTEHSSVRALRSFLAGQLPEYMIPARFVQLEAFPLNENGKINRKQLPDPVEVWEADEGEGHTGPQNDMEHKLLALWRDVLKLDGLGIHDHFFESGGNSLLAVKLHQRIDEQLPGRMKVVDLFAHPTVSLLAYYLTEKETALQQIDPIQLPDHYYSATRQSQMKSVYTFPIPAPMHSQIQHAAAAENISVEQICLSVYAYLFHEVTKQERISISAVTSQGNRMQHFTIPFEQISGLQGLFKWMQVPANQPPQQDYLSCRLKTMVPQAPKQLFPLFYVDRLLTLSQQGIDYHGITLAVNRNAGQLSLICEFNASLLDQGSVAALFRRYLELLHRIGKYYDSSVSIGGAV